jgi:aspartate 1-decarboxylase
LPLRFFLRSKIHNATVTEAKLDYVGSITIDADLMKKAGILEHEKVLIVDNTNGDRIETYVIKGPARSGVMCINGGAAHRIKKGDEIIIMTFEMAQRPPQATIMLVDKKNRFVRYFKPSHRQKV